MPAPRLYINGDPTNACKALRMILKASDHDHGGLNPNDMPPAYRGLEAIKVRTYTSQALLSVGWIEQRRSGPRGGLRYFITDMGRHVLKLVDEDGMYYVRSLWAAYPEMMDEMRKLGLTEEDI